MSTHAHTYIYMMWMYGFYNRDRIPKAFNMCAYLQAKWGPVTHSSCLRILKKSLILILVLLCKRMSTFVQYWLVGYLCF